MNSPMFTFKGQFQNEKDLVDFTNRKFEQTGKGKELDEVKTALSQVLEKLGTLESKVYQSGDDDVGGVFEKKITDADLLETDGTVHHDLLTQIYTEMAKVDRVDDNFNENSERDAIYKVTGAYELRLDLNRPTLERLLRELKSAYNSMF